MTDDALVEVRILQMPIALWQQSQQHSDELLREFLLIASERRRSKKPHDVPERLTALIDELTAQYGGLAESNDQALADAAARGVDAIDLVYSFPTSVAAAAHHLGELLDEADDYCQRGEHLLTLATPPAQVAFRRWYLDEIVRQIGGEPPMAWTDYAG